jgi:uncharacterized membrane protein
MIAWNAGALCLLALTWLMMFGSDLRQMRRRAQRQDAGRRAMFIFIAAATASILAIGFLLRVFQGQLYGFGDAPLDTFGSDDY